MPELLRLVSGSGPEAWFRLWFAAFWLAVIAGHVAFAIGVAVHARGRLTMFVPGILWPTLATGLLGAMDWVVHCSRLARPEVRDKTPVRRR